MFGKLTLSAVPYHEPIVMVTLAVVALLGLGVVGAITYYRKWTYLWTEWLTSVDHKKIGVMYIVVALVMLVRGFADAIMMRGQLALAEGANHGYLPPEHYDQIFTAHGVIMIIFMAMPFMTGLMNLAVPLQIGARDVAFPFLNSLSFWLLVVSAMLVNVSLGLGEFARTGWVAYPPLSELAYSPGVGVDYYIWALQISGMGTLLTGINFLVTVFKMRAPGMKLMQMPIFTWTCTFANILIVASFPILTAALGLLSLDRYLDMHFFTNELGGNAMMYINLFWAWGHPEVYILILPAFGIFSEVTATFAGKRMFGYKSMVWASAAITFLGFTVWLHHFFTMGSGGDVNGFFGVATMLISIPTGVKLFNWLFTIYKGRLRFSTPILWTLGFMVTFTIGGMTGVLLAIPGADFLLHNSLFLIAHFHNTIIGGAVFGYLAGFAFWFPKAFGFTLDEKWGKRSFWCWLVGFYMAFHAALHPRLHGHDPSPEPLRQPAVEALPGGRVLRRRADLLRHRLPTDPAVRLGPQPQATGRRQWRPVGRPHPGMGHFLAAAVLQLRRAAEGTGRGCLPRHEEGRHRLPQAAGLPADPHAEEHRRGLLHRRVRLRLRLRRHLAYLVAHGGRLRRHDRLLHRAQLQPGRRLLRPARRDREDRKRPFPATRQAGLNHVDGSIEQASGRRPRSGPRPRSCTR